jgi:dienelactone hydrolase
MRFTPLLASALMATALHAGQSLDYKDGKTALQGYLSAPADADKAQLRPGVLIVHQWLGLTDYEKGRADQIAKDLGYVALAADIYGAKDKPADQASAGKAAGKYKNDFKLYRARVKAGLEALKKQPGVDPKNIAVIGYCFGGMGALEAARANMPVKAVVSFHGALATPDTDRSALSASVLALHGADDPFIKAEEVAGFEQEMRERKADWQLVKYSGAVHAFTQPMAGNDNSKGAAYNATADKRSWQAMKTFLADQFGR